MKSKVYFDGKELPIWDNETESNISAIVDRFVMSGDECFGYLDREVIFQISGFDQSKFTFDEGFIPETVSSQQELNDVAALIFVQMAQTEQLDDVTIAEHPTMFHVWTEQWTGKAGTILQDEGGLYRSIHDVGPGQNTKPSQTPAMWTKISDPTEEWPEWIQPIGVHDSYAIGAKVSHNTVHWISMYDNNVWEPGIYGWEQQK